MQDIIVMLLMLGLATYNTMDGGNIYLTVGILAAKIIGLGGGVFLASKYFIPKITEKIAESQEYLFLFAIGRCFILGSVFHLM
jgi:Kef-type K+ transport system membrane component KefB